MLFTLHQKYTGIVIEVVEVLEEKRARCRTEMYGEYGSCMCRIYLYAYILVVRREEEDGEYVVGRVKSQKQKIYAGKEACASICIRRYMPMLFKYEWRSLCTTRTEE